MPVILNTHSQKSIHFQTNLSLIISSSNFRTLIDNVIHCSYHFCESITMLTKDKAVRGDSMKYKKKSSAEKETQSVEHFHFNVHPVTNEKITFHGTHGVCFMNQNNVYIVDLKSLQTSLDTFNYVFT